MKINNITQLPFGTVLSLSENIPAHSVGKYLTVDGSKIYKIKGTPSNIWTELLIEKTNDLEVNKEIKISEQTRNNLYCTNNTTVL